MKVEIEAMLPVSNAETGNPSVSREIVYKLQA